jgi:hypothetical protein
MMRRLRAAGDKRGGYSGSGDGSRMKPPARIPSGSPPPNHVVNGPPADDKGAGQRGD